jgi:hypothetical protein
MSLTVPPDLETRIWQQAVRAGLSPEERLQQQALGWELEDYAPPVSSLQDELMPSACCNR